MLLLKFIHNIIVAVVPAAEPETKNTDAPIDNNLIMFDTRFDSNSYAINSKLF